MIQNQRPCLPTHAVKGPLVGNGVQAGNRLGAGRARSRRSGLTLLEVLISLAIFFMSIIAISALVDMAKDKAAEAEYRSVSLLVAESKMAELKSGVTALQGGSGTWETDDRYTWNISVSTVGASLSQVNITAQREGYPKSKVDLAQLVIDPSGLGSTMDTVPDPNATTTANANSSSGSSAGGASSSSKSSSGGSSTGKTGSSGSSLFGGTGGTGSGGSSKK